VVSQKDHDDIGDGPSYQGERVPIPSDEGLSIQSFNANTIALSKLFELISTLVLIDHIDFKDYCDCNKHEDDD